MRLRWSRPALEDLKSISQRIEDERNLDTADRICRSIYQALQALRLYPQSGRLGSKDGTRELVISKTPYIAVYRVKDDSVEILHIHHGAQDWR
jgi:toxin ParE1/3/4